MQPRDDENVISGRLLKCEHHVRIDEAAVAQQHRSQHRRAIRLACKKSVEAPEKISASARKSLQNRWRRAIDEPQQFAAAQRTSQIDFLAARDSREDRTRRDRGNFAAAARVPALPRDLPRAGSRASRAACCAGSPYRFGTQAAARGKSTGRTASTCSRSIS